MADEVIDVLRPRVGGIYFDGTLGGGGHTQLILNSGGRVIATDKDSSAIEYAGKNLTGQYKLVKSDFKDFARVLDECGIDKIDGALLDLGVSSYQIDTPEKGFSYRFDGPLDMRMDGDAKKTAYDIINKYKEQDLVKIFFDYGEEKFARKIAGRIIERRKDKPIATTSELAELIRTSVPFNPKDGHPAKRVFQAVRIEVNGELEDLGATVEGLTKRLKTGGRLAVITFHSLEDRIVKNTFQRLAAGCLCDKSIPICVCGHTPSVKNLGKRKAGTAELKINARAASATLRAAEKI